MLIGRRGVSSGGHRAAPHCLLWRRCLGGAGSPIRQPTDGGRRLGARKREGGGGGVSTTGRYDIKDRCTQYIVQSLTQKFERCTGDQSSTCKLRIAFCHTQRNSNQMFSAISMWTWVLANVCFAYSAYSAPSTDKKHHHLCFCPVISPSHNISSFGFILRLGSYDAGCSSFLQWTYIMCVDTGYRIVDIDPSF